MERRTFLKWLIHGLNGIFAVVLGVPAIAYLIDPRNRPAPETALRTVAQLGELQVGVPFAAVVRATRRDAWTLHPNDIIGRVWLIRQPGGTVKAFTQICPHLGCPIGFKGSQFTCPCHHATFDTSGQRLPPIAENPAANMDELKCEVDGNGPTAAVKVEYKNFIQGKEEKVERK